MINIYITMHINNNTKKHKSQLENILNEMYYLRVMEAREWVTAVDQLRDICNLEDIDKEEL